MAEAPLLSFEIEEKGPTLKIAFNRAGAEHLIEQLRTTLEDGDHVHDFVGAEGSGGLTRKKSEHAGRARKVLEVRYQLLENIEDWS